MGFKGSLESFNLADIFQNLSMNQQTGTLRVTGRNRMKCIYFQGGQVRFLSRGMGRNVLLGEMLVGRGLATREQVDAGLAEQKNSGRLLGEIVVELGVCSRDDIDNLVRFQIEEEIYDLFGWESADFEFADGPPPGDMFDAEQQATELALNTSSLIMEAARRIDEWERIREAIPSMSEVFVPVVREPGALAPDGSPAVTAAGDGGTGMPEDADPASVRIFAYLGQTRDVESVVEDSYFSSFEVASALVEMLEAGYVREAGAEELKAGASTCMQLGQPQRAARLTEKALSLDPSDPAIREGLADALVSLGEKERAAIHLGVLGDERAAQGDKPSAIAAYEKMLAILPQHPAAHEKLARLRAEEGERELALRHYAALIQSLIESGRFEEAQERCREGLALDPENTELRSALAKVLLSSGDEKAAIEEFERLGEVFARAGSLRPAAEVFRRILQIDPRSKHAKNRLRHVLSGGLARKSHAIRNVAIVAVLAMLVAGAYVVFHELALQERFGRDEAKHQKLMKDNRFEEASALWAPYLEEWSILLDYKNQARDYRKKVEERREEVSRQRVRTREEAEKAIKQVFDEAKGLAKGYQFEQAREKLLEVIDSEFAAEEMKAEAKALLAKAEKEHREVREFLDYKKEAVKREELASLKEELARTRVIFEAYPANPALKRLERPLRIETDPPGTQDRPAEVYVEGDLRGPAPIVIRFPLDESPQISVKMPGYVQTARRLVIPASASVKVVLRRQVAWRYDAGARVFSLTKGPQGILLVADQDGVLAAVSADPHGPTGARKALWPFRTGEGLVGIVSGVLVHGNSLYLGTDRLYALDVADGPRRRWRTPAQVGGRILAPPAVGPVKILLSMECVFGTCVGADEVGAVWAVESKTGKVRWHVEPSSKRKPTRSRPFLQSEQVFVPFDDGEVYALQAASGAVRATWSTGSIAKLTSIVWDGRYGWVGRGDGKLVRLDLRNPNRAVRGFDVGRSVATELALHDGTVYFGDSTGALRAFSLEKLDKAWKQPFVPPGQQTGRPVGTPAVSGKRVYFGTDSGWVYAVDRATGKLVWKDRPCAGVRGGVLVDGRYLYAGGADGVVYAYDETQIR